MNDDPWWKSEVDNGARDTIVCAIAVRVSITGNGEVFRLCVKFSGHDFRYGDGFTQLGDNTTTSPHFGLRLSTNQLVRTCGRLNFVPGHLRDS